MPRREAVVSAPVEVRRRGRGGTQGEIEQPLRPSAPREAHSISALEWRPAGRWRWAPPLAIGLLAAGLRLWAIDLAPFGYDEVDVLGRARAVVGGALTQVGPLTSWGIPDPPGSVYLMTPPAALPRPALAAAAWVALLNVLAVLLTYAIAARFFGPGVALAAGLLYAVNPWAIYFSRRTWAEIVPLFTAVALWAALEVICRGRSRWAVAFFLALALQVQTRILALAYAPAALLAVALFPRRWGLRWPALGIALGVLVSLPYLAYVAGHWTELLARLDEGDRGIALDAPNSAPALLLWTAAGYGLLPAASKAAPWLDPLGDAGRVVLGLVAALLAAGLGLTAWALVRRRAGAPAPLLAALFLLLPFLTLLAQSSSVYLHYMVILFPALFLVLGLSLGALLDGRRPLLPLLGGGLLVLLCAVQLATTAALYRVMAAYELDESAAGGLELRQAAAALPREAADQLGTGERYGVEVPLRFWQAVADASRAEAARLGVDEIWVLAGATDPLIAERPALLDYLLRPELAPHFLPSDALVFPVGRPTLMLETPDVDPAEPIERFGVRRAEVPLPSTNRVGRDRARLMLVEARSAAAWAELPPSRNRAAFVGGVELLGFRANRTPRAGDDLPVVTYWRLGPNAAAAPPVAVRLVDAGGRTIAQPEPAGPLPLPELGGERILIRRQQLAIAAQTPPGDYRLEAVLGDGAGGLVPRSNGAGGPVPPGTARGDNESLATIRVSAP